MVGSSSIVRACFYSLASEQKIKGWIDIFSMLFIKRNWKCCHCVGVQQGVTPNGATHGLKIMSSVMALRGALD